jgi:hypothetical protein
MEWFLPQVIETKTEDLVDSCWELLEGKHLTLRIAEKDDVSLVAQWWSDSQYIWGIPRCVGNFPSKTGESHA